MVKRFEIPKGFLKECKRTGCDEREFVGGKCKKHHEEALAELNKARLFKQ